MTSPVRLGVSPAAAPTPTGVFTQMFEALFPHAGTLGCVVWVIPVYLCVNVEPLGATRCFACPVLCHSESGPLGLSVHECRASGSASGWIACPVRPTLRQSWSPQCNASPLCPGCPSLPLPPVWMNVYFLSTWCRTSLPFDFLSVLVVRGGAVCLLMPPSWFSMVFLLLTFSENFILFSIVIVPFCILIRVYKGSLFSTTLSILILLFFL